MYIPLAISLRKKNLVAFDKADSLPSSHVLGVACLKPFGHTACVEPPVVRYSVTGLKEGDAGFHDVRAEEKPRTLDLVTNLNIGGSCSSAKLMSGL